LVVFSGDVDTTDFPTTHQALAPSFIGGASDGFAAVHDTH
jgi:hypothetical protein